LQKREKKRSSLLKQKTTMSELRFALAIGFIGAGALLFFIFGGKPPNGA